MNYCCHADFTNTGNINITDKNVYVGYQTYAAQNYPGYTSGDDLLTKFTEWYDGQVSLGTYAAISGVVSLPGDPNQTDFDCANYTETEDNVINIDDMNTFIAYQTYASQNYPGFDESAGDNMITKFLEWYDGQKSLGVFPTLFVTPKHLPSLKEDSQVWTINGLVEKCVTTDVEKLWISFTGNGAYSDWYELETDEEEDFTKFKIATADYGTSLQNWAIGKATNLQGINITSSINQPSSTELTEDQKAKTFNSDLLGFGCDGDFNNNHGVNVQQVNMRIKAYDNQNSEVTKKYGSDDNTHGYVSEGTPWEGSNMVYRTTTFNSLVIDNSGKNSIDIDYIYFIKETNEDEKIKFSAVSPPNKTCGVWS